MKVSVGKLEKKEVSELNNKIYLKAREMMESDEYMHRSHIGWSGIGAFIDWLEENYKLREKVK